MSTDAQTTLDRIGPDQQAAQRERMRSQIMVELTSSMPQTPEQARVWVHAALQEWKAKADTAVAVATAFYDHDRLSAELRLKCTDMLQADVLGDNPTLAEGETGAPVVVKKGMSYSQSDKAASAHPLYVAHKAEAQRRGAAKAQAENAAQQALETLHTMQEYLRAFTAAGSVHVVTEPPRTTMG